MNHPELKVYCPSCGKKWGAFEVSAKFSDGMVGYHYHCPSCNLDFAVFDNLSK